MFLSPTTFYPKACDELKKSINTTLSGAHFLTRISLGCGFKIVLMHRRTILEGLVNNDHSFLFNLAFEWISTNVGF